MTQNQTVAVSRSPITLKPDPSRVLLRPFQPGDEQRTRGIVARILALPDDRVALVLKELTASFSRRHQQIRKVFLERYEQVREMLSMDGEALSEPRRMLIGSHFLAEYSLESAALFNPSIVPHPDQSGLPKGSLRFILSLRATGEGHVSSLTFRSGVIGPDHSIEVTPAAGFLTEPRQVPNARYEKPLFARKLAELGLTRDFSRRIVERLANSFTLQDLRSSLEAEQSHVGEGMTQQDDTEAQGIWLLARSNYEVQFRAEQRLSERILFPATPSQRNGIEDARFVRFQDEDGSCTYYATFAAYDGRVVMPELVETNDFLHFRFITLNGPAAQNKGMAIFPRRINGLYAMLSRQDNENMHLMFSDHMHFWNERQILLKPEFSWELIQIGNCGSPIETEEGWLVLSHGVGPMRQYSIGALLLDLDDPSKVIRRLREPLLTPNASERDGYVPNVVYTCGAILHRGVLIIPYGMSDHATGFASVRIDELLGAMQ